MNSKTLLLALGMLSIVLLAGYPYLSNRNPVHNPRNNSLQKSIDLLSHLPAGDISSTKCNELIKNQNDQFIYANQFAQEMAERSKQNPALPTDYVGYSSEFFIITGTKYLYSHHLCLAYLHQRTYLPLAKILNATSTTDALIDEKIIVDLGSQVIITPIKTGIETNNVLANLAVYNGKTEYWLFHKQSSTPFDIDAEWQKINEAQ